jgi:hypothetical protein
MLIYEPHTSDSVLLSSVFLEINLNIPIKLLNYYTNSLRHSTGNPIQVNAHLSVVFS